MYILFFFGGGGELWGLEGSSNDCLMKKSVLNIDITYMGVATKCQQEFSDLDPYM